MDLLTRPTRSDAHGWHQLVAELVVPVAPVTVASGGEEVRRRGTGRALPGPRERTIVESRAAG